MAHRTKEGQEKHDTRVASVAINKRQQGFGTVSADLPGHPKPPNLNGHIPDVYAELTGLFGLKTIHVVEVETNASDDADQHLAFRRWARDNGATFEVVMA